MQQRLEVVATIYVEQRIEGAILIPDYEIADRAEEELPDRDALILVYCRSGRRSALAAQELANMGYTNVYDFGGIIDWPFDTVSGPVVANEAARKGASLYYHVRA